MTTRSEIEKGLRTVERVQGQLANASPRREQFTLTRGEAESIAQLQGLLAFLFNAE